MECLHRPGTAGVVWSMRRACCVDVDNKVTQEEEPTPRILSKGHLLQSWSVTSMCWVRRSAFSLAVKLSLTYTISNASFRTAWKETSAAFLSRLLCLSDDLSASGESQSITRSFTTHCIFSRRHSDICLDRRMFITLVTSKKGMLLIFY